MAEGTQDLYKILGIRENATNEEIKKSYHKLAKEFHPDKNPQTTEQFKLISFAYTVLSNTEKRRKYDIENARKQQEELKNLNARVAIYNNYYFNLQQNLYKFYAEYFKDLEQTVTQDFCMDLQFKKYYLNDRKFIYDMYAPRTNDIHCEISVKLSDFYVGNKEYKIPFLVISKVCFHCNGNGFIKTVEILPSMPTLKCQFCHGRGEILQTPNAVVLISKGMHGGQKCVFRNKGNQRKYLKSGHIIVTIREKSHSIFKRFKNDLQITLDITLTEALCGFIRSIEHLDGRKLLLRCPPGDIVQIGQIKGIQGEGMPFYENPLRKGNLYVQFNIEWPKSYSPSLQDKWILFNILPPVAAYHRILNNSKIFSLKKHREKNAEENSLFELTTQR